MSQENVEVVRQIFAAFNRRDWGGWESHHHPEVEWTDPAEYPGGGIRRGAADIRRLFEDLFETGDDWHVEVDAVESVGKERVLMRGRSVLVGRVSRIPVEDPLFQLFSFEDGRVHRVQTFRSSAEALEAAGLGEQAMAREDVEVVRRVVWDGVDAVALVRDDAAWARWSASVEKIFEPDCAFAWIAPGQRVDVTGLDAFRRFCLDWFEPWDSVYADIEQIFPAGDNVVMVTRHHGRMGGDQHDAEIEQIFAGVYHVRDGKVPQVEFYTNRAAALEAVGLQE